MTEAQLNTEYTTLHRLLDRQRAAFLSDGPPDLAARKRSLVKLRKAVIANRAALEEAINADFGHRSRHETGLIELLGIIQGIDYYRRGLPRFMRREKRHVAPVYWPARAYVEYQPRGVVGVMAPWNYPVSLAINPLTAALAAGNRVMIKPSEATPHTSAAIQQMLATCFAPEEVSVVLGGPDVGAAFSALPFDHLLFTGSTEVGRSILRAASENLVPVTLELGGKCPAVIAPGRLDDRALAALVFGKLSNAGQTCVAPDYLFVHHSDMAAFVSGYKETVARFYPSGPASSDYSNIVNDKHITRLTALLSDAQAKGATVVPVGPLSHTPAGRGQTIAPTLILGATDEMRVMQEEIFGPIMPVLTYDTIEEVIAYVNARPRPLALYYFGAHDSSCKALMTRTISGGFGINNTLLHAGQEDLPFGGVGASGMGAYHGVEGFRTMSHAKAIFVQSRWSLVSLLHAPFGKLMDRALAFSLR